MEPKQYMFKVLTMTNEVVKEAFSFNFYQHNGGTREESIKDHNQVLRLSRDLQRLLESYSDSRCRIYQREDIKGKTKIDWVHLYNIKKYPTPLQGAGYANFLFSPNFDYFVDVAVIKSQFCIR
jgi:hypothetical protein